MDNWVLIIGLTVIAIQDWRTKEISLFAVGSFSCVELLLVIGRCLQGQTGDVFWQGVTGVLPGVLLLAVSHITNGSIGEGDGWLLAMIGLYLGAVLALVVLWLASVLVMLAGGILLIRKRVTRKTRLPWAPFAWGAYVILWGGGVLT